MEEIWKDVPEYEGLYEVSNYGDVKSLRKGIFLKPAKSNGYLRVALCNNGKKRNYRIHQIVAMAFLNHTPNKSNKKVVDHKDNIRSNNKLDNLQIISNRENTSKDKKGGTSKYVGVFWHRTLGKYQAQIKGDGKSKCLGYFDDEYEAHIVYQKALQMFDKGDLSFMKAKEWSSQYKGVSKKGNRWAAAIKINKNKKHLGVFDTELEAHNEVLKQKSLLL